MGKLAGDVLQLIGRAGTLCLDVENPGWDNARGYLFDETTTTLYFPIAKQYLPGDPANFSVLIWNTPGVVVVGDLRPASSAEELAVQLTLAAGAGLDDQKARQMLVDRRSNQARRTRYKLIVRSATPYGS